MLILLDCFLDDSLFAKPLAYYLFVAATTFTYSSWLNCLLCVRKTCSCAKVSCVLTCSRANIPYVLKYSRANVPSMLTFSGANVTFVLTCSGVNVPCTYVTYLRLRTHVLTCLACLRAHVSSRLELLRVSRVIMLCVLMYSRVNVPRKLTCSPSYMPRVPCLKWLTWPFHHLPTCLTCLVSSFDVTFFSLNAIFNEALHTSGKVWQFV